MKLVQPPPTEIRRWLSNPAIPPSGLSESLNISIFRIIQESLTNALKHSSASKVSISMNKTRSNGTEQINLKIQDDGVGLDEAKIKPGLGLLGMKERVEMNGGKFELTSELNNGVSIDIVIPLVTQDN